MLKLVCGLSFLFFVLSVPTTIFAQGQGKVELNGDTIEYSRDGNVVIADGNVIVKRDGATLYSDHVEFARDSNIAVASGNVRLKTPQGEVSGETITFNFATMTGDFNGAKMLAAPYFGGGREVKRVSADELTVTDGFITTCDHDKPHYHVASKRIDVYPNEKIVARGNRLKLGSVPLMYMPRYTHWLDDTRPRLLFTPGYDSDWGAFLLTQYRFYMAENVKGIIHADYRTKLDFGSGFDVEYNSKKFGNGLVRTYYTHERRITSEYPWQDKPTPTVEDERFKGEWRHKWKIDGKTNAIWQYYKISDNTFLKDFFEREYEDDSSPDTFFLLTRQLPKGLLSFRTDVRVNRFEAAVERLPELRYDLNNTELGDSNVYFRNTTTYSNLVSKTASPSEIRQKTQRLDMDYEFSYPTKVSFLEFRPYIGSRHTYYSRAKSTDDYDSIRGMFKTGASLSTKFYRVYDTNINVFGFKADRLRHIITPTIQYDYTSEPTVANGVFDTFDSVDTLSRVHNINYSLENKLQTKRNDQTVDLLRAVVSTDHHLKEDARKSGIYQINADIDFHPSEWLSLYFDSEYDTKSDHLTAANFDIFVNGGDKWSFGIGHRYSRNVDDQLTTEFRYKINRKWAFRMLDRFDLDGGKIEEQEYTLTRDLHAWEMDFNINDKFEDGSEFVVLFRLKAFPEIGADFGTRFNKPLRGSQGGSLSN